MKKVYLMSSIILLSFSYSHAQKWFKSSDDLWRDKLNFGLKVGANYSNVYNTDGESFNTDPKLGFAAGAFIAIPFGEVIGIQPEILFSQKGYKANGSFLGGNYELTRTSNYIDIPLLITLKPAESFTLMAGPQYSYLISQKNSFENGVTTIEQEKEFDNEDLRKNTFCFTGGFDLNFNKIVVGARVGWDLYKNNSDGSTTTPRYKNTWYQLTLGYRF